MSPPEPEGGRGHPDIGKAVGDLTTPALLIDLPIAQRNVQAMAEWAEGRVQLRPHAKTHKSVELARAQIDAGAVGITVATVWEAGAMLRAGVEEVLIANEVTGKEKLTALAELARLGRVIVAVDSVPGVDAVAAAALRAGVTIGTLVEIDVGMGRGGVRSCDEALRVARRVEAAEGAALRGVMGYEGHCVLEPDRVRRAALASEAMDRLLACVATLRGDGLEIAIVSAGGTNTHDITGAIDGVTELQVGTYALMDLAYAPLAPAFAPALTVLGRAVARHDRRVILDCGSKTVGALDFAPAAPRDHGLQLVQLDEEHALIDVLDGEGPLVGEVAELVVGYCGGTVNLHSDYRVVRDGRVVDVWTIVARGSDRL